jgi:hypothetical protein
MTIKEMLEAERRRREAQSPAAVRKTKDKSDALRSLRVRCPYFFDAHGKLK